MNFLPEVAIVILNWNGRKFLEQFLPSVLLSSYSNKKIIIADNFSTDDSLAFVEKNYPAVQIIRLTQNWGFAKGYNEALTQVDADYFVILNSDVEVTPGWLEPMVNLLENDATIAACQPKLRNYRDKKMFEYAGAAGGWIDRYGYPFTKGRVFEICEEDKGQYDQTEPIFWASGASLFIRSSVFHEVKGFDDYFFAHQEEIDLCWRIQLAGYKIYACPSSVVYHVGGGTLQRGNPRKTYLNFRNNHIMLHKNLPLSKKIWIIPVRVVLDTVSAFKGLFSGEPGYFWAIVKAQFAVLKWFMFDQKQSIFPLHRKGDLDGYFPRSIIWLYFIKGKNTFSAIVRKKLK